MDDRWRQLAQMIAITIIRHMDEYQARNGNGNGPVKIAPRVFSTEEAAVYLGLYRVDKNGKRIPSASAIYHLVGNRRIPVVRRGRKICFLKDDLDRWLEGDRV